MELENQSSEEKSPNTYVDITVDLTDMDSVNFYDKDYVDCTNIEIYAKKGSVTLHYTLHIPHNKNNLSEFKKW